MSTVSFAIRELDSATDYQACIELQQLTWGPDYSELVPITMLKLAQRLGGIVAGAFTPEQQMLGFVLGMTGLENGQPIHWSDMLAVRPSARDLGIGEALKRHQRQQLLNRRVRRMYWTFDPLESRNAHINFARLGVSASEYTRDLYGTSDSPLHAGIGTDRLVVTWQLDSMRVTERLAGVRQDPDRWSGVPLVNPVVRTNDIVTSSAPLLEFADAAVSVAIPLDIQSLKKTAPQQAASWRQHTRAALEHYLAREYVVIEYVRGNGFGRYVLDRRPLLA